MDKQLLNFLRIYFVAVDGVRRHVVERNVDLDALARSYHEANFEEPAFDELPEQYRNELKKHLFHAFELDDLVELPSYLQ